MHSSVLLVPRKAALYLIVLVRTTHRMHGILPGYYENYNRIRALLVSIHGEEQTKSFLIGLEPMT